MMNRFPEVIRRAKKIGVACHTFPDGDALGSVHAMVLGLRSLGKEAYILSKDAVLDSLDFLPLTAETNAADAIIQPYTDLIIVLDCGNFDRVSFDQKTLGQEPIMILDHHKSNDKFGEYNHVDTKAAATGEIVFDLLALLRVPLTQEMAVALYTAITTDTGSFRFENTTPRTMAIAGNLLALGVPHQEIARRVFDEKPLNRVRLMGRAIETLESHFNGRVNLMIVREKDFLELALPDQDTGDLVNLGLSPKEAEVSMILKETEGKIRVSIRTKRKVDAGRFAEVFQGGGHVRAAGCTLMTPSLLEAKERLLQEMEAYLY
ncbi:3'-to-5' oligoribonuclease A [Clostridiaceae bacterium JG1575]|nr:3'-to-5' oligoribonuclease A [Clostridiaceae bacterium JG1575]